MPANIQHKIVDNGITLCKECHKKTFNKEKEFEKYYKGLLAKTVNSGELLTGNAEDNPEPSQNLNVSGRCND